MRRLLIAFLAISAVVSPAVARDTSVRVDSKEVIDPAYSKGALDGSVRFYFAGQPTPAVTSQLGGARTSRKTNAVGKSDAEACKWVMLTALQALQAQAKSLGANAVVGITSAQAFSNGTQVECRAGSVMAGVSLKGKYVKLADR